MRVDASRELLSITDILSGLNDLERFVFSKEESQERKAGLLGLQIACQVFQGLAQSPLPMFFSAPHVKECCNRMIDP